MNHYVSIVVRALDRERGRKGERYTEIESGEEVREMARDAEKERGKPYEIDDKHEPLCYIKVKV